MIGVIIMYNEELKKEFITSYTDNIRTAESFVSAFNRSEKYEEELGMDISAMPKDELEAVLKEILGIRERSQIAKKSLYRMYIEWCIENNIPGARDDIFHIKTNSADKMRKIMIPNPRKLQYFLDSVCEPETEQTSDDIVRCGLWFAFSGIDTKDACNIEKKDIDFNNLVISYRGMYLPIYREAIPSFRNCAELLDFRDKNPRYKNIINRERVPGTTLLRGYRGVYDYKALQKTINRKKRQNKTDNINLSYTSVFLSGIFYRAYEDETAGLPVNFFDVAEFWSMDKPYKNDRAKIKRKAREYKRDYIVWKEAFNL